MQFEELAQRYRGQRAQSYDSERERSASWKRETAAVDSFLADIPRGAKVVDVPLGTGRFLDLYVKYGLAPTGFDISPDMLAEARAKADRLGLAISLREADIRHIDAPDGAFDVAVCIRFLNWIDFSGFTAAVTELARVSRSLIVGVTCYVPSSAPDTRTLWQRLRGLKRKLKHRIKGSALVTHDKQAVEDVFAQCGLTVAGVKTTNPRDDRSDYFIYFLRREARP